MEQILIEQLYGNRIRQMKDQLEKYSHLQSIKKDQKTESTQANSFGATTLQSQKANLLNPSQTEIISSLIKFHFTSPQDLNAFQSHLQQSPQLESMLMFYIPQNNNTESLKHQLIYLEYCLLEQMGQNKQNLQKKGASKSLEKRNNRVKVKVECGFRNLNESGKSSQELKFIKLISREIVYDGVYHKSIAAFVINREKQKILNFLVSKSVETQPIQPEKNVFSSIKLTHCLSSSSQTHPQPLSFSPNFHLDLYQQIKTFKQAQYKQQKKKLQEQQRQKELEQQEQKKKQQEQVLAKKKFHEEKMKIQKLLELQEKKQQMLMDHKRDGSVSRFFRKCACCRHSPDEYQNELSKSRQHASRQKRQSIKRGHECSHRLFNLGVKFHHSPSPHHKPNNLSSEQDKKTVLKSKLKKETYHQRLMDNRLSKQSKIHNWESYELLMKRMNLKSHSKKQGCQNQLVGEKGSYQAKRCLCCANKDDSKEVITFRYLKAKKYPKHQNNFTKSFYVSKSVDRAKYKKKLDLGESAKTGEAGKVKFQLTQREFEISERKTLSECDKEDFQYQFEKFSNELKEEQSNFEESQKWNLTTTCKQHANNGYSVHEGSKQHSIVDTHKFRSAHQQKSRKNLESIHKAQKRVHQEATKSPIQMIRLTLDEEKPLIITKDKISKVKINQSQNMTIEPTKNSSMHKIQPQMIKLKSRDVVSMSKLKASKRKIQQNTISEATGDQNSNANEVQIKPETLVVQDKKQQTHQPKQQEFAQFKEDKAETTKSIKPEKVEQPNQNKTDLSIQKDSKLKSSKNVKKTSIIQRNIDNIASKSKSKLPKEQSLTKLDSIQLKPSLTNQSRKQLNSSKKLIKTTIKSSSGLNEQQIKEEPKDERKVKTVLKMQEDKDIKKEEVNAGENKQSLHLEEPSKDQEPQFSNNNKQTFNQEKSGQIDLKEVEKINTEQDVEKQNLLIQQQDPIQKDLQISNKEFDKVETEKLAQNQQNQKENEQVVQQSKQQRKSKNQLAEQSEKFEQQNLDKEITKFSHPHEDVSQNQPQQKSKQQPQQQLQKLTLQEPLKELQQEHNKQTLQPSLASQRQQSSEINQGIAGQSNFIKHKIQTNKLLNESEHIQKTSEKIEIVNDRQMVGQTKKLTPETDDKPLNNKESNSHKFIQLDENVRKVVESDNLNENQIPCSSKKNQNDIVDRSDGIEQKCDGASQKCNVREQKSDERVEQSIKQFQKQNQNFINKDQNVDQNVQNKDQCFEKKDSLSHVKIEEQNNKRSQKTNKQDSVVNDKQLSEQNVVIQHHNSIIPSIQNIVSDSAHIIGEQNISNKQNPTNNIVHLTNHQVDHEEVNNGSYGPQSLQVKKIEVVQMIQNQQIEQNMKKEKEEVEESKLVTESADKFTELVSKKQNLIHQNSVEQSVSKIKITSHQQLQLVNTKQQQIPPSIVNQVSQQSIRQISLQDKEENNKMQIQSAHQLIRTQGQAQQIFNAIEMQNQEDLHQKVQTLQKSHQEIQKSLKIDEYNNLRAEKSLKQVKKHPNQELYPSQNVNITQQSEKKLNTTKELHVQKSSNQLNDIEKGKVEEKKSEKIEEVSNPNQEKMEITEENNQKSTGQKEKIEKENFDQHDQFKQQKKSKIDLSKRDLSINFTSHQKQEGSLVQKVSIEQNAQLKQQIFMKEEQKQEVSSITSLLIPQQIQSGLQTKVIDQQSNEQKLNSKENSSSNKFQTLKQINQTNKVMEANESNCKELKQQQNFEKAQQLNRQVVHSNVKKMTQKLISEVQIPENSNQNLSQQLEQNAKIHQNQSVISKEYNDTSEQKPTPPQNAEPLKKVIQNQQNQPIQPPSQDLMQKSPGQNIQIQTEQLVLEPYGQNQCLKLNHQLSLQSTTIQHSFFNANMTQNGLTSFEKTNSSSFDNTQTSFSKQLKKMVVSKQPLSVAIRQVEQETSSENTNRSNHYQQNKSYVDTERQAFYERPLTNAGHFSSNIEPSSYSGQNNDEIIETQQISQPETQNQQDVRKNIQSKIKDVAKSQKSVEQAKQQPSNQKAQNEEALLKLQALFNKQSPNSTQQKMAQSIPQSLFEKLSPVLNSSSKDNTNDQKSKRMSLEALFSNLNNFGKITQHPAILNQVIKSSEESIEESIIVLEPKNNPLNTQCTNAIKYSIKFINKYWGQKFIEEKIFCLKTKQVCLFIEQEWKLFSYKNLTHSKELQRQLTTTNPAKDILKKQKYIQTVLVHILSSQITKIDVVKCIELLTGINFKKVKSRDHQLQIQDENKLAKKIKSFLSGNNKEKNETVYTQEKLVLKFDDSHMGLISGLETFKSATKAEKNSKQKSRQKSPNSNKLSSRHISQKKEHILSYTLLDPTEHHTELSTSSIFLSYLTPSIKFQTLEATTQSVNTFELYLGNCMVVAADPLFRFILYKETAKDKYEMVKDGKGFVKYSAPEEKGAYLMIVEPLNYKKKQKGEENMKMEARKICIRYYFKELAEEGLLDRLIQCLYSGKAKTSGGGYENEKNLYLPVQKQQSARSRTFYKSEYTEMND